MLGCRSHGGSDWFRFSKSARSGKALAGARFLTTIGLTGYITYDDHWRAVAMPNRSCATGWCDWGPFPPPFDANCIHARYYGFCDHTALPRWHQPAARRVHRKAVLSCIQALLWQRHRSGRHRGKQAAASKGSHASLPLSPRERPSLNQAVISGSLEARRGPFVILHRGGHESPWGQTGSPWGQTLSRGVEQTRARLRTYFRKSAPISGPICPPGVCGPFRISEWAIDRQTPQTPPSSREAVSALPATI